jgi:hypothetical protein
MNIKGNGNWMKQIINLPENISNILVKDDEGSSRFLLCHTPPQHFLSLQWTPGNETFNFNLNQNR